MDSKYYKWSKSGNKMIINSGFKEFDRQTNCISGGNISANTMYGNYIRTWNTTECNGTRFEEGHLFNYDLKYFDISQAFKAYIRKLDRPIVLYEIFIYTRNVKDVIGWLVEDKGKIIDIMVAQGHRKNYNKRFLALETVKNILEEGV